MHGYTALLLHTRARTHTHTHTQIRVCLHHGAHEPVTVWMHMLVAQLCLTPGFSPWNSTGKNTGVGSHSLLQGIMCRYS